MFFKRKPWRSGAYLAHVREYNCAACDAFAPSEPHHWRAGHAGTGTKVGDQYTTPLCRKCHREWHDHGVFLGLSRQASERLQAYAQRQCMADWIEEE